MLSETKQKFFWARWRDEILSRQRAQKTFAWLHTAFETDIFLLPSLSRGTNFWHIFSKGWKFFTTVTKHFYTFLPLIPSDKFWRNFCIFPWRNCGRKIRDFKEWSKIRVSCFFWQIKVGKNKEFWTQANVFESNFTFQANAVRSQTKDFSSALARRKQSKIGSTWKVRQMSSLFFPERG